jgi:hypothetical protein
VPGGVEVLVAREVLALDEGGFPAGCDVHAEATVTMAARSHQFARRECLGVTVDGDAVTVRDLLAAGYPRAIDARLRRCLEVPPSTTKVSEHNRQCHSHVVAATGPRRLRCVVACDGRTTEYSGAASGVPSNALSRIAVCRRRHSGLRFDSLKVRVRLDDLGDVGTAQLGV